MPRARKASWLKKWSRVRKGDDLLDHERGGEDSWCAVEGRLVLAIDVGAAAELVANFDGIDLIATGLEAGGGGEAAEAAADDEGGECRSSPRSGPRQGWGEEKEGWDCDGQAR